jgi:hypothetical protein
VKTETIIEAIKKLDDACTALRGGRLPVEQQVKLGTECLNVAFKLTSELVADVPNVNLDGLAK